jgi:hypothetical protein
MKKTFEAVETVGKKYEVFLQILTRRCGQKIWFQAKFVVTLQREKQSAARYWEVRIKTE